MSFVTEGCLVFDIGAHHGESLSKFSGAGAGTVISVEASYRNYLMLLGQPKVNAIHAAAWSHNALVQIFYAISQSGLSTIQHRKWSGIYPDATWAAPEWVPTITLAQMVGVFGRPHIIKVDVEGSELQVLQGLPDDWSPSFLMFEFHQKAVVDAIACLDLLALRGYRTAHYVREDVDIETVPSMPIAEFKPQWLADAPEWGNITVAL